MPIINKFAMSSREIPIWAESCHFFRYSTGKTSFFWNLVRRPLLFCLLPGIQNPNQLVNKMSSTIHLNPQYGYVLLAASGAFMVNMWQSFKIMGVRKQFKIKVTNRKFYLNFDRS